MNARAFDDYARICAAGVLLFVVGCATLGRVALLARRRERLSERLVRLGLMDDHLAEWR